MTLSQWYWVLASLPGIIVFVIFIFFRGRSLSRGGKIGPIERLTYLIIGLILSFGLIKGMPTSVPAQAIGTISLCIFANRIVATVWPKKQVRGKRIF